MKKMLPNADAPIGAILSGTAVDAIRDPDLVARAKADLAARTASNPYVCPIPPEVQPPIHMSRGAA